MVPGSRSRSPSGGEDSRSRRRRYLDAEMGEVSDPDEWMALHHYSSSSASEVGNANREGRGQDEPEGEPSGRASEDMEKFLHWDNRIFLIFNVIMQEKVHQVG